MEWISVKDRLPEQDCVCVVCNSIRPFNFYISIYSKYLNEFEVSLIGMSRFPDALTFNATHWMPLPKPPKD